MTSTMATSGMAGALRPVTGRLAVSMLLGSLATLCSIGLLAVSGWLIVSASLQPPVSTLAVAIVAVRAFGVGKGAFRYAERLVSHDAVLRAAPGMRVASWARIERLAPFGLRDLQQGDLLARLVSDVEGVNDLALRVLLPAGAAAVASAVTVLAAWLIFPPAGAVLAVVLAAGATAVPWAALRADRLASGLTVHARGEYAAAAQEVLRGQLDLTVSGAWDRELDRLDALERRLADLDRRSSTPCCADTRPLPGGYRGGDLKRLLH